MASPWSNSFGFDLQLRLSLRSKRLREASQLGFAGSSFSSGSSARQFSASQAAAWALVSALRLALLRLRRFSYSFGSCGIGFVLQYAQPTAVHFGHKARDKHFGPLSGSFAKQCKKKKASVQTFIYLRHFHVNGLRHLGELIGPSIFTFMGLSSLVLGLREIQFVLSKWMIVFESTARMTVWHRSYD